MECIVRTRFKPITLCGDLQKTFLKIWIKADDRDALRFHWIKERDLNQIETLWFKRLVFGLVQSPFILGGTLQEHLGSYIEKYPTEVSEIKDDLYVDDLISGGNNFEQVASLKDIAIEIFNKAGFKLHKWHSNVSTLEEKEVVIDDQTYAKQQLGVKLNETKMLGLPWNKDEDTLAVEIPSEVKKLTTWTICQKLWSSRNNFTNNNHRKNYLPWCMWFQAFMGWWATRLDYKKVEKVENKTTNKSKSTKKH